MEQKMMYFEQSCLQFFVDSGQRGICFFVLLYASLQFLLVSCDNTRREGGIMEERGGQLSHLSFFPSSFGGVGICTLVVPLRPHPIKKYINIGRSEATPTYP